MKSHKLSFFLVLMLLCPSLTLAQGEGDVGMRSPSYWSYGVRGGFNFTMMTLDPKPSEDAEPFWLLGVLGGLEVRYSLLANLHADAQVLYTQRYSRWEGTDFGFDFSSNVYLDYIDVPLTVQWYPMRGPNSWWKMPSMGLEPFIYAGPQISFLAQGAHAVDFLNFGGFYPDPDTTITDHLKPLEISILGGAGLRLHLSDNISLSGEAAISIGLTDVNDSYLYEGEDYIGKNREIRWMVGLLYRP